MSTEKPAALSGNRVARRRRILLASLAVGAVVLLRHDYWQWTAVGPVLLGVLPVGLWWQAGVSVLASLAMALMVRWAWPAELEQVAGEPPESGPEPPRPDGAPRR